LSRSNRHRAGFDFALHHSPGTEIAGTAAEDDEFLHHPNDLKPIGENDMSEPLKLREQFNEWRDDRQQAVRSRTVRVKGHEVMVTYKRRPAMRATPEESSGH
jgi:hypothetical protein